MTPAELETAIANALSRHEARTVDPQAYPPMEHHRQIAREVVRALPSTPPLYREAVLAEGRRLGLEEAQWLLAAEALERGDQSGPVDAGAEWLAIAAGRLERLIAATPSPPPATGGTDADLDLCRRCGHERVAHDVVNGCCADECEGCNGCPGFEMSAGPATGERGGRTAAEERADVVAAMQKVERGLKELATSVPGTLGEASFAMQAQTWRDAWQGFERGDHIGAATAPGGGGR